MTGSVDGTAKALEIHDAPNAPARATHVASVAGASARPAPTAWSPVRPTAVPLLPAQRSHRIDPECPSRRHIAGRESDDGEQQRHGRKHGQIARVDPVQQRPEQPEHPEGRRRAPRRDPRRSTTCCAPPPGAARHAAAHRGPCAIRSPVAAARRSTRPRRRCPPRRAPAPAAQTRSAGAWGSVGTTPTLRPRRPSCGRRTLPDREPPR